MYCSGSYSRGDAGLSGVNGDGEGCNAGGMLFQLEEIEEISEFEQYFEVEQHEESLSAEAEVEQEEKHQHGEGEVLTKFFFHGFSGAFAPRDALVLLKNSLL